jgi:hypothetical protein
MTNVTAGRYALGVLELVIICGSLGGAALAIRRRVLEDWAGAPARLAEVVLALALLVALTELLGVVGLFAPAPMVAASLIGGALGWRFGGFTHCAGRAAVRLPPLQLVPMAVAGLATAAVFSEWAVPTLQSYDVGMRTFDSLWYHLPWAASFAQSGQITQLRFTDVEYLTAFYPATAELFHGVGIVLFARDTLSPGLNLLWLGLLLLAAYCVGRPRGVGGASMMAAALAMATPMMRFSQPGSAANDVVGMFFVLASAALLANARQRRAAIAIAGLAAGLAISVKLSMVAAAVALTLCAVAAGPPGRRRGDAGTWLGMMVLGGGFWYLRNLIAVGNPLPWVNVPLLAHPTPPLQQHTGFAVVHYLTNGRVLSKVFEPGLAAGLGGSWAVLVVAALLGAVVCLLPGASALTRALGLVSLVAVVAYVLTPESAAGPSGDPLGFAFNLRYAAPALLLCLVVAPRAPILAGPRRQAAVLGGLALLLGATLAQSRLWPASHVIGAIAIGLVVLGLAIVAVVGIDAVGRLNPAPALLAAGCALVVVVAAGGYVLQRHYLQGRYVYHPGVSSLAKVWELFRHVHGARVGIVGTFGGFFSYPLFGVDDSNRVMYLAQRGPHGSFTPIASCAQWRSAVNAARLRYLVTTPARDPWRPTVLSPSPESGWIAGDPAVRVRYSQRAVGQTIRVYQVRGQLDPSRCPARSSSSATALR